MIKGKIRFGQYEYNVWESDRLWMAKMVDSKSPFWDFQECSLEQLFTKMKGCHDFPLVIVKEIQDEELKEAVEELKNWLECSDHSYDYGHEMAKNTLNYIELLERLVEANK